MNYLDLDNNWFRATALRGIAAQPVPCPAALRAPEQGTDPCARRMSAGEPAPVRRARGSAPRLDGK